MSDINLNLNCSTAFFKHYEAENKIVISQGSARSSKTFSILQLLIIKAFEEENQLISIVAENKPFLRRGVERDFKQIMIDIGEWEESRYNKTESQYKFDNDSVIEFFSVENFGRALGSARDYLFVNECNNIHYETVFQLMARTRKKIYMDFNPISEFWVHTEIMQNSEYDDQWSFVKTTYKDNEFLDQAIIDTMLARAAKDENYRRVYIEGEVGVQEGVIFDNYKLIHYDEFLNIRNDKKITYFGLDFGYTNDPTSICEIYINGDVEQPIRDIYINEVIYSTKLSNKNISDIIKENKFKDNYKVIADSAEPKSIDEIFSYGVNIFPVKKGADSINYGINLIKNANVYITNSSYNVIKEFRNYKWATNKVGDSIKNSKQRPIPIDNWNHAIDGIRYVVMSCDSDKYEYKRKINLRRPTGLKPV